MFVPVGGPENRSLAGVWLAIYLASHHPSCWNRRRADRMESRGIVVDDDFGGGGVNWLSSGPTVRLSNRPGDQQIGQHTGWFHNLLLMARDWGELCSVCFGVSRGLPTASGN